MYYTVTYFCPTKDVLYGRVVELGMFVSDCSVTIANLEDIAERKRDERERERERDADTQTYYIYEKFAQ